MNSTYILQCRDGTFYIGWTKDLEKRIQAHNLGRGAKYTRGRGPVKLMYYENFETKEEAMKAEARWKKLSRKEKEEMIKKEGIFC